MLHIIFNDDCTYFGDDFGELAINYGQNNKKQATFDYDYVVAVYKNKEKLYGKETSTKTTGLEVILHDQAVVGAIHEDKIHINMDANSGSWRYSIFDENGGFPLNEIKEVYEGSKLAYPESN